MKTTTNFRTIRLVQLALFIAIVLLMAFTPIGYIRFNPALVITLLVIPVSVGAIILGPAGGAILGGVFGITSLIQCFGADPFGAMLLSINPAGIAIACIVPRVLMGWLTGLIFKGLKKIDKTRSISFAAANLAGPILNTALFMTALMLFFYNTDYIQGFAKELGTTNVFAFVIAFIAGNVLVETSVNFIAGTAISKAIDIFANKAGLNRS